MEILLARDKIGLKEKVRKLYDLNQRISHEANNLTKALKRDSKIQGNWGELIKSVEKIKELGAKNTKLIPGKHLIENQ